MSYLGDILEDGLISDKFTSRDGTGLPTAMLGTPSLEVYKIGNATPSTAGITFVADYSAVTGLNNWSIDTSADAFYELGKDYEVVVAAGTVDGVSVIGEVVGSFSIENRVMRGTDLALLAASYTAPDNTGISDNGVAIGNLNNVSSADVNTACDTALTDFGGPTLVQMTAAFTEIKGVTWSGTDTLEAIRDRGDTAWTTATTTISSNMRGTDDALLAASYTAPDNAGISSNGDAIGALNNFDPTAQMAESYATNGVAPTFIQAQFAIHQMLMQFGIAGTSLTVRKLDNTSTAFIVTLNDDTNPTDAERV